MDIPSYILGRIKGSGGAGVSYIVVEELPTTGEEGKIYLVPKEDSQTDNVYNEYMYIEEEWELIGDTQADISGKQDIMQFSTMPTASEENVGKLIQYIGTSTNDYKQGYFYICVHIVRPGTNTYVWNNVKTQDGLVQLTTMPTYSTSPSITEYANQIVQYVGETDSTYTKGYFYIAIKEDGRAYSWKQIDVQGGISQYTTMPSAGSENLGKIVQYVGTTGYYTNGYFYKCVNEGTGPNPYLWKNIEIQPQAVGVNTIIISASEDVLGNISDYNTEANRQALAPFINDLANIDKYTIILKLKEYGSSDGSERYIPLSNKKFTNSGRAVGLNFINLLYNNISGNLYTPLYNYNFSVSISENINISSATRTKKYTLANTLKLSQIDTLPLAQSSYLGYIYQYIGTTTQDYTNGYFYKCVQDGSTYKWENIEVQSGGGSSAPAYIEDENGAKLFFVNKTTTKSKMYSTLTNFVKEVKNQPSSSWDTYPRLIITDSAGTDSYSNFYNNNITGIYCCDNPTSSYIMLYRMSNNIKIGTNENGAVIFDKTSKIRIDYNSSTYEVTNVQYYADNVNTTNFLSLNNTTAYTPTGDYNPATKKYVDDKPTTYTGYDATKTQVLKNINGTLTWVDET